MHDNTPFGPTGAVVFSRTYSRTKPGGGRETWPETVARVVKGNLAFVHGSDIDQWDRETCDEYFRLVHYMERFALIPAGRHLWSTGVPDREYLMNCWVAPWGRTLASHFSFSFLRLMEGGGVGSSYSSKFTGKYGVPRRSVDVRIVCDDRHEDIEELKPSLRGSWPELEAWPVRDSREGWADALTDLLHAFYSPHYYSGGVSLAYDVTKVRPSGSELKTFGGTASGPAPFARMMLSVAEIMNKARSNGELTPLDLMEIDHAIAECVVSGGNRRSARMSLLPWNDPHIMEFLNCKQDTGKHWTTNISVEIDDEFLKALSQPYTFTDEKIHQAHAVHTAVTKAMLENGEPGYWNRSLNERGEPGEIIGCNPCSEIPLESGEPCNLGHINLDFFAKPAGVDFDELYEAHRLMTRFLVRATFADVNDQGSRAVLNRNRRIGVGHLGVQGYWAKRGIRYSEIPACAGTELKRLYREVRQEARTYAFQLRIPEPVKVTTVAPTGSIAKLPGVSEGIHPIYARHFERRVRFSVRDESQREIVNQAARAGFDVETDMYDKSGMTVVVVYPTEDILLSQVRQRGLPDSVVQSTEELSVRDMLRVQRTYQADWADNAVSYTVNIPEGSVTADELADTLKAYLPSLKGTTVMVDASRPQAPYTRITREEYEAAVATKVEDSTDESCKNGVCPVR